MTEPKALSASELADRIRLAARLAKARRGKHRAATATLGLTLVEQLKVAAAAHRYEPWGFIFRRTTQGWKRLEAIERELRQLAATGQAEQNSA